MDEELNQSFVYNKLIELVELVENENLKYGYDFTDIQNKVFLKDILNRLHELRQIIK